MNPLTEALYRSRVEEFVSDLLPIPAGWFQMGCETGQDNEKPVHGVWVDEFLLAACQVTNAQYQRFLRDTASPTPPFWNDPALNDPKQPVVGVSWHEATRYCEWLTTRVGTAALGCAAGRCLAAAARIARVFRLPSEAEWERAARGGNTDADQLFPWGNTPPQDLPSYAARHSAHWKTGPEPVGRDEPNAYGLHNMCDNVHEWCSDWYAADYYAISPEHNPRGPETGERRSSRGGSWRHHIKMSRCAARSSIPPEFQYADYGFRVTCTVTDTLRQSPEPIYPLLAPNSKA